MSEYPRSKQIAAKTQVGATALTTLFLTEVIKTPLERMQLHRQLQSQLRSLDLVFPTLRAGGWRLPWRGLSLNMWQSVLTAHLYTDLFPAFRNLVHNSALSEAMGKDRARSIFDVSTAGVTMTLLTSALLYPFDLAKTLVMCSPQAERSQGFHGSLGAVGRIFSLYGLKKIYHGFLCYIPTMTVRTLLTAVVVAERDPSEGMEWPLLGFFAAQTIVFPLDTLLRRVQIQIYSKAVPPQSLRQIVAASLRANPFPGLQFQLAKSAVAAFPLACFWASNASTHK